MAQKWTLILRKPNGIIHVFGPTTIRTIVSLKSMKIFDKLIGARGFSCISTLYMKFCTQPANYTSEKHVHFQTCFQKY